MTGVVLILIVEFILQQILIICVELETLCFIGNSDVQQVFIGDDCEEYVDVFKQ